MRFSIWFAGVINIVFAVMTLHVFRRLSGVLVGDGKFVDIFVDFFNQFGLDCDDMEFVSKYEVKINTDK